MNQVTQWDTMIYGKQYKFTYETEEGRHIIAVNDDPPIEVEKNKFSKVLGIDKKISFDGMDARLVVRQKKPDIALHGFFLQSREMYKHRAETLLLVFAALFLLLAIVTKHVVFMMLYITLFLLWIGPRRHKPIPDTSRNVRAAWYMWESWNEQEQKLFLEETPEDQQKQRELELKHNKFAKSFSYGFTIFMIVIFALFLLGKGLSAF